LQLGDWATEFVFFGPWQDQKRLSLQSFPKQFASCTLILDGKAFKLKQFSTHSAQTLYLPEIMTRKDHMCYKHKPPQLSCIIQV
jgi:hypothetical protein